jgi:pentatricopeptide repeat protein
MKPDVVLYTMLMDTLLKAREFDRADQIWNHMQHQDSSAGGKITGLGTMESVPRSFSLGRISTNAANTVGLSSMSPSSSRPKKHSDTPSPNSDTVTPNLQTLSVLMQSHIRQSDIDGVTRTYKQLHQTTLSRDQQGPINIVLINQILKVLVDLGETDVAREIFAGMQIDGGDVFASLASGNEECANSDDSLSATPIHHQTSRRRATWEREIRKKLRAPDSETVSSTNSTTRTGTGLSIRPNEATCRLMLQVARREKDSKLESQVLKELRRCPSLSSSEE